jgi:hypothetical protein
LTGNALAETILGYLQGIGVVLQDKIVGQGYDGASNFAGYLRGAGAIIQMDHPMANVFHCCSHRLNLVLNDVASAGSIHMTRLFARFTNIVI